MSGSKPGADFDLSGVVGDSLDYLVVNRLLNVEAGARAAALAVIEEDSAGCAGDCGLEICIFEYDVRRFSAEFQRHFLQIAGGGVDDQLADFCRSGKGDFVHVRMCGQCCSGSFAITGDDIDHALGKSCFHDQFAEAQRGKRSLLGRLQYDGASRR